MIHSLPLRLDLGVNRRVSLPEFGCQEALVLVVTQERRELARGCEIPGRCLQKRWPLWWSHRIQSRSSYDRWPGSWTALRELFGALLLRDHRLWIPGRKTCSEETLGDDARSTAQGHRIHGTSLEKVERSRGPAITISDPHFAHHGRKRQSHTFEHGFGDGWTVWGSRHLALHLADFGTICRVLRWQALGSLRQ